jgi:hypothetical protein
MGIGIAHCGQSLVVGAAGAAGLMNQRFTSWIKRNTQNATIRKLITVFRNIP